MKSKPCSCFLASLILAKNLCESFVPFFRLCGARLLTEIRIAVRKFVKSHNNKSFIELACSDRIGKILVSFFFCKFRLGP